MIYYKISNEFMCFDVFSKSLMFFEPNNILICYEKTNTSYLFFCLNSEKRIMIDKFMIDYHLERKYLINLVDD